MLEAPLTERFLCAELSPKAGNLQHSMSPLTGQSAELRFTRPGELQDPTGQRGQNGLGAQPHPTVVVLAALTPGLTGHAHSNHSDKCGFLWRFP